MLGNFFFEPRGGPGPLCLLRGSVPVQHISSLQISTVNLKPLTTYALPQHNMTIWMEGSPPLLPVINCFCILISYSRLFSSCTTIHISNFFIKKKETNINFKLKSYLIQITALAWKISLKIRNDT